MLQRSQNQCPFDKSSKKGPNCLLREYIDIFVWVYDDILGLNTIVVSYKLLINPCSSPVKQKTQKLKPELNIKIN